MGPKNRVLFVRRGQGYGGSEVVVLDLLRGINYEQTFVYLASTNRIFSEILAQMNLPVKFVPLGARSTGGFLRVFVFWVGLILRLRPQKVVLAEGGFREFSLSAVIAACILTLGRVYVMAFHPPPDLPPKTSKKHWGFLPGIGLWWYQLVWSARWKGKLLRKVVAISKGVKEKLENEYGFDPAKVTVVYHGVDTSTFSPASIELKSRLRKTWGVPENAVVIVSTARLAPIKRLDRLIESYGVLTQSRTDLWMLLTGDGPLLGELQGMARSVSSSGQIKFLGQVSSVCEVLQAADIYALPSDEEGLGIALAEAMSCGLISVATSTVGPREIIKDGQDGFLVEINGEGVLEGLRKALGLSETERRAMSLAARQTILDRFRLEDSVAKGLDCLEIARIA